MNIVNTNSGQDFSSVTPIILVNESGYSVADPTVKVVEDISAAKVVILVNTSGYSI